MPGSLQWDIFCQVIDNFGDIGVCWRLATQLAGRGQRVRLWVDDASALTWMAPQGCPGVQVRAWTAASPQTGVDQPGDVVVEAFGCKIDAAWLVSTVLDADSPDTEITTDLIANYPISASEKRQKTHLGPVWINLEYLSAEAFVERNHGLASPVMHGPAKGMTKWFFYPGFTARTGGLLAADYVDDDAPGSTAQPPRISLFCYEPPALAQLIDQLGCQPLHTGQCTALSAGQPTELLVTSGRASVAVQTVLGKKNGIFPTWIFNSSLSISEYLAITALPLMPHEAYDTLLRSCQLNFVRGEDSLVRALWAGQALVWQIYPQSDGAHAAKLDAFLDWLDAPADLRLFHHVWNGLSSASLPPVNLPVWQASVRTARQRLRAQPSLADQIVTFSTNALV